MKYLCIFLIRFYQKFLSPLKRQPCCRFSPTCSAYAIEAFRIRGFFVGLFLSVWRILRCNPFCAGGYDPVPEKGLRYKGNGGEENSDVRRGDNFVFIYDLPLGDRSRDTESISRGKDKKSKNKK